VKARSLLIAITGQGKTLGNVAVTTIDTCISQHLLYAGFHRPDIDPHFMRYFFETRYDHLRQIAQGGGTTKGALTCGFMKGYPVPLPADAEQREIASILGTVGSKIHAHEAKQRSLQELFKTMLNELMTGKIRAGDLKGA
jgi:type I restriction enzyme S subunit